MSGGLEARVEAELDRLAWLRDSPDAFEALFRVLWTWRQEMRPDPVTEAVRVNARLLARDGR